MIDYKKRTTLKTIAAGASFAMVPVVVKTASAGCPQSHSMISDVQDAPAEEMTHATLPGLEIDLDAIPDSDEVWVRLSNVADKTVMIRHIDPGVVRLNGRSYDVNSIFDGPSSIYYGRTHSIEPGNSYSYIVAPLSSAADAVDVPTTHISPFTATISKTTTVSAGDVLTPRLVLA